METIKDLWRTSATAPAQPSTPRTIGSISRVKMRCVTIFVPNHRHERMTVKALPGSSLEVIETEFFFQLLVSLLANPSRPDGGRQGAQVHLCRQVGEIVFLLSRHPV